MRPVTMAGSRGAGTPMLPAYWAVGPTWSRWPRAELRKLAASRTRPTRNAAVRPVFGVAASTDPIIGSSDENRLNGRRTADYNPLTVLYGDLHTNAHERSCRPYHTVEPR